MGVNGKKKGKKTSKGREIKAFVKKIFNSK